MVVLFIIILLPPVRGAVRCLLLNLNPVHAIGIILEMPVQHTIGQVYHDFPASILECEFFHFATASESHVVSSPIVAILKIYFEHGSSDLPPVRGAVSVKA